MPPLLLVDLSGIDPSQDLYGISEIEKLNPHRFEMRHLDGIVYEDLDAGLVAGYKDVTDEEFWVRGHIPGRPILPGVIMVEAAAQLASFYVMKLRKDPNQFIGFSGIENVKFRRTVVPGERLYLLGKFVENRPRRFMCDTQGVVDGQLAFQARIIGMPV